MRLASFLSSTPTIGVLPARFALPSHRAREPVAIANQSDNDNISLRLIRVQGVERVGMRLLSPSPLTGTAK